MLTLEKTIYELQALLIFDNSAPLSIKTISTDMKSCMKSKKKMAPCKTCCSTAMP